MELQIDASSAVPIYRQVVERVRGLVARRALRPGDRMPSVRELAATLRINRNTAAKAYAALEVDGILQGRAGNGTFVAADAPVADAAGLRRRIDAAVDRLIDEARELGVSTEELADAVGRRLRRRVPPGEAVGKDETLQRDQVLQKDAGASRHRASRAGRKEPGE